MVVFVGLLPAVGIITIVLGDVSGVKNGTKVLEILLAYPEMVKMLFSPRVISVTPSSQPSFC